MAAVDLATDSIFARRYRILGRLASGGMGAVYEALHLETRRRRALKVMLPELFSKPELRDRFRREAHVTASVKSEFLVDVFDAGLDEASGMPFLVMELLEGEDLGRLVDREGALAPSEVVTYLAQVASALDRTHTASIIHRDLKPENLFLTHREDGSACIKILDFGISKIMNEVATGGPNTTSIGTPAYMAPEQIVGGPVSPAADIHALGLIAYTLLTGRAYWQDDVESTDNALAFALRAAQGMREGAVSRANRHGYPLPNEFDPWFTRAVALDPKQRFKTATEAVHELAEALGLPRTSVPSSPLKTSRRGLGRAAPGASLPRSESEHAPSTMHGAELGPAHRKPIALVRWLALGAALGLVGIGLALFATTGAKKSPPAAAPTTDERASALEPNPVGAATPIVAPVEGAVAPSTPTVNAADTPASAVAEQTLAASPPKPASTDTKAVRSALPSAAMSPVSSAPPAPATASFPPASASARPKVKYTRD